LPGGWTELRGSFEVASLTSGYTSNINLSSTFGIERVIDESDGAEALIFDVRVSSIYYYTINVVRFGRATRGLTQLMINILLL